MRSRARSVSRSTAPGPAPMKWTVTAPPRGSHAPSERRARRFGPAAGPLTVASGRDHLHDAPDRHRHRRAPAGEPADRRRPRHRQTGQLPAEPGQAVGEHRLRLQRDGVRDEPASRAQGRPAGVEHAGVRDPPADEHRVRRRAGRPAPRGPGRGRAAGAARRVASAFATIRAARASSRLDRDGPARPVRAQPLDPDRPVAGPDVPQQLARAAARGGRA